jgi:hypothetical protein
MKVEKIFYRIVLEGGIVKLNQNISVFVIFLVFLLGLTSCNTDIANPLEIYQSFDGVTVYGFQSGLMWQKKDDGVRRTWNESKSYCQNLILAGFNDWRLPVKEELSGLILKGHGSPTINEVFYCRKSNYWCGDESIFNAAWYVDFRYGLLKVYHTDYPQYFVRCVR